LFKYVVRRLLILIPILLGVALISSLMFYIVPGDIVRVMLGQHVDPYTYANVRTALGLDIPFGENFLGFMRNICRGDLGFSYIQQRSVNQVILEALPVTIKLTVVSLLVTIIVGIPVGILAAVKDRRAIGQAVNYGAMIGFSMPSFLLALFLQLFFGVWLGWFPIAGSGRGLISYVLPGLAIGLPLAAFYARVARASMLEVLTQEYILFATARGLPFNRVIINHGLRNALIPVITQIGMDFGMFMTGAVLTETIFNLPGMGRLIFSSINARDFPVLRGALLFSALIVVIVNLLVDLSYIRLDPRIASAIVREGSDADR